MAEQRWGIAAACVRGFVVMAALLVCAAAPSGALAAANLGAANAPVATGNRYVLPVQGGSRQFNYPQQGGAVVDACVTWATDCGRGGADQFCRQQGFRGAISWYTFHPGRTYVIGSRQICTGNNCTGFQNVVCGY